MASTPNTGTASSSELAGSGTRGQADAHLFEEMEPKIRQSIRAVGRTMFCFKCEGSKELASYYCACGSFLCALHLAEHSCLVSASLQYNEELIAALC